MAAIYINFIQAQPPQRLSWLIWAAAVLILLTALSLIVYLFIRLRRSNKEPEEEWSLSSRSLFTNAPTPPATQELPPESPAPVTLSEGVAPAQTGDTLKLHSKAPTVEPRDAEPWPAEKTPPPPEPVPPARLPKPARPPRPEPMPEPVSQEPPPVVLPPAPQEPVRARKTLPLEQEVWDELELPEPQPVEPPPQTQATRDLASESQVARVAPPAGRAPYTPPRIEPVAQREPYTPPAIEPVEPRRAPEARPAVEDRPVTSDFGLRTSDIPARGRKVSGGVLGLPVESSDKPMVFGTPAPDRRADRAPSLANYGKDLDGDKSYGGLIALAIVALLLAGGALAYFYVPSVNARVNDLVARIRSRNDPPPAPVVATDRPRAQVNPALNPEVVRNTVKARGAVTNISNEALEGLAVEVSLRRRDGAPEEARNLTLNPDTLAPRQRGLYEFDYDGKVYEGYSVVKLTSKGEEVKFIAPGQK